MNCENYYVYFITNKHNNTLYIGVTNNLERRMWEHKHRVNDGFSKKYNLHKLVYYETFLSPQQAIAREKQLKNWHREWKNNLIQGLNKDWNDLSAEWDCFRGDAETSSA